MNKSKFSDNVTKLATIKQAQERYKICRGTLVKYAEKNGAIVRFGRSVRIDIEKMDAALSNESEKEVKV